jgi:hypothetical protein
MGLYGGGGGGGGEPGLNWKTLDPDITKWSGYQAGLNAVNKEQTAADSASFSYNPLTKEFVKTKKETNLAVYRTDKNAPDGVNIPYTVYIVSDEDGNPYEVFGRSSTDDWGDPVYRQETRYAWVPFSEVVGRDRDQIAETLQSKFGGVDYSEDGIAKYDHGRGQSEGIVNAYNASQENKRENASNAELNKQLGVIQAQNQKTNDAYDKAEKIARAVQKGDYVNQRNLLDKLDASNAVKDAVKDGFKNFYRDQKLEKWDPALGAKPPYGDFDPKYYEAQNLTAAQDWKDAVSKDDLDITERYGKNNFYLQNYTTQGKAAGLRGNAAEITEQTNKYIETKPTDKDLQNVRDLQLGIDTTTQTQRLLNIPEIAAEFEKARNGDPYWSKQAKEKFLDPSKPDEFAALFRLSERPEDKQVSLNYNVNAGYGVTELEDALNQAVGEKSIVDTKRFGALTQNVLQDTIKEMKKAKAQEETLSLLSGFGGFSEIMDINKTLTNSILGDTGIGGMLSFTSAGKAEESLEKSLQNITGVRNNATYNWQQWFDNALKTKYDQDLELGYTTAEATDQIKIDSEFARQFIDDYLIPRFNTSKSMDEFVEYLDVRQEEQNPFQTQDMLNATSQVANLRAQAYLDQLKATNDRYFNSDFYFNPTGDKAREGAYTEQASTVASDWEAAKKGDGYWAQQAYRFGVDVNDKQAFARMHFQVKGQGKGYDGADDILNAGKVQDEIFNNILPALKEEVLKQGSIFGQFVTPEEFADEMLRGLDPEDKSSWNEVLQRYGLTEFKGTVDELKEYIKEALRTGSAQEIREKIKYLNEKRKRPTQQVLGLTYIERPEDFKDEKTKPTTELFNVFQSSGYQGTEDEFYNNFFPDLDRSEQKLLTKSGKDSALTSFGLDLSDPFASLGTIESFLDEDTTTTDEKTEPSSSSFFSLGSEEDEDTNYKSKTGEKILGEFTSMFKGL